MSYEFTMGLSKTHEILYSMWIIDWKIIPSKENKWSSGNAMSLDTKAKPVKITDVNLLYLYHG